MPHYLPALTRQFMLRLGPGGVHSVGERNLMTNEKDVRMKNQVAALLVCGLGFISSPMQAALAGDDGESCKVDGKNPDLSVSASPDGGFDVFSTTISGVKLVKGSPFALAPNPVPTGLAGPVLNPMWTIVDPAGTHVYALYRFGSGTEDLIWSFKASSHGLKQENSAVFGPGPGGPHDGPGIIAFAASENHVYVITTIGLLGTLTTNSMSLYTVEDGHFKKTANVELEQINGPGFANLTSPSAVRFDGEDHFMYLCFSGGSEAFDFSTGAGSAFPPSVAVFHLEEGVPSFVVNSISAEYISSKCP